MALAAEIQADTSDSDEGEKLCTFKTRKEQKALDREIPWREIVKMPRETVRLYEQAAKKEYDNWLKWGSIREVPDEEAAGILRDRRLA